MSTPSAIDNPLVWVFTFTLKEPCTFEQIRTPDHIRLLPEPETNNNKGARVVSSFNVRIEFHSQEVAYDLAVDQANRLKDVLAVLSRQAIELSPVGYALYRPNGGGMGTLIAKTATSRYHIRETAQAVDLRDGNFPNLIRASDLSTEDQRIVEAVNFANNALKAEENEMYEVMVRDFYLVIEKEDNEERFPQTIRIKFKYLRHALSHAGKLFDSTRKGLCDNFGKDYFDFTFDGAFDHGSHKNHEHVKIQAETLRGIVLDHLRNQL